MPSNTKWRHLVLQHRDTTCMHYKYPFFSNGKFSEVLFWERSNSQIYKILHLKISSSPHQVCCVYVQVESVGSVEGGLLGMAWSPDQELVVFTTAASSLLLMTHTLVDPASQSSDLVPVTEVPMCPSEFGQGRLKGFFPYVRSVKPTSLNS